MTLWTAVARLAFRAISNSLGIETAIVHVYRRLTMFSLETDRLTIRPWEPSDRRAFTALTLDAEVMQYVHRGLPYSEEEADEWFARQARVLAEHGFCMGAMIENASGRLIGIAGMQPLGTTGELEIGWWLARDVWGRGYATEAGRAAMCHVLEIIGRSRVVAIIHPDNEPSKRVASRLGMQYEARYTGTQLGHRKPEIVVDLYFRER
ncbi:MAG TPA: GNAT family N-acetyltransferase [Thermoanaerobaculia bacterium]|nr:GNAT family N-acetyltransferase [Thermoanaerobaculia bacterium]